MSLSKDRFQDIIYKIEFIANNEGCELADGYRGLLEFFANCADKDIMIVILDKIRDMVDDTYDELKSELKSELKDSEPTAVLVRDEAGDWQGLYLDNKLVAQNHSILIQDIPWKDIGYNFKIKEAYIEDTLPEWLYML